MDPEQMAMPAEMAAQGPSPEEMAIYDQMRQQISPQEFSNEMLASASQVDPQAVAEFTAELQDLDISPEELDALNDLVDEVLANPEQYDQLRQKYISQGLPDDILPEQFDPYFFAALNMAVDQMIAAPSGVQAFADGGIAELKPIAQAIASYGRNGDTMLAHITPAEARMLRRRGGSGTINPVTGLPEFFLKKAFKKIGNAVKKFASSTVGRLVTTVALGFFLGPAAASLMGVGAGTAAGMAISGFVGGAGSTLLAGGNLKDALKAGAIGGLTAGVAQGLSGAPLTGPATMTPGQALQGQVDKFTGMFKPGAAVQAPTPSAGAAPQGIGPNQAAVPPAGGPQFDVGDPGAGFEPMGGGAKPTLFEQGKKFFDERISPSGIRAGATPAAQTAGENAVNSLLQRVPTATPAMQEAAYQTAFKAAMPGIMGTYGPMAAVGLGTIGAFGGFESKPVQGGDITKSLMKPVTQRIREAGTQREMYMQGLPGVVYDEYGAPVFGQSTRLPTYDVPDYNYGGFNTPFTSNQGIMNLPTTYIPPTGSIGSRTVAQPYNTASMYTNLLPRGYADGGEIAPVAPLADGVVTAGKPPVQTAAERQAMLDTMIAQQRAGQQAANQARAMRRAGGSGAMYANINAGLAALAPENNPMDVTDTGFGARNRAAQFANLQQQYGPMFQNQQAAMAEQAKIMGSPFTPFVPQAAGAFPGQPGTTFPGGIVPGQIPGQVTTTRPPVVPPVRPPVTPATPVSRITDYLASNPNLTDRQIRDAMNQFGVNVDQMATITGLPVNQVQQRYNMASDFSNQAIQQYLGERPNLTDRDIRTAMDQFGVGTAQVAAATGLPFEQVQARYEAPSTVSNQAIQQYLAERPNLSDRDIRSAMDQFGVTPAQMAAATGVPLAQVQQRYDTARMNQGGIAALAQGGYPRRTGQISGPGTEKSDSIPAMLSDGEFVMTAKAVRGAGKGSRRAGAKQMYKLMHQLEKNAERG